MNTCHDPMKCKTRNLFINLALSLLIGCIAKINLYTPDNVDTNFGTLAETVYFHGYMLDLEETSVFKHGIIFEFNEGNALRHFPQTKRISNSSTSKYEPTFIKRSQILYPSPLIIESCRSFLFGLTEAKEYLISIGKLII